MLSLENACVNRSHVVITVCACAFVTCTLVKINQSINIPERLRDASCGGAIKIDYLYFYLQMLSVFSAILCTAAVTKSFKNITAMAAIVVQFAIQSVRCNC